MLSSFRVEAADNGYTLCYCEKTKAPGSGDYGNMIYKDVELVYPKGSEGEMLTKIASLVGSLGKGSDEDSPIAREY